MTKRQARIAKARERTSEEQKARKNQERETVGKSRAVYLTGPNKGKPINKRGRVIEAKG